MGTAIVLLVLIVIVIFSLCGYLKKTRYGCCGSGGGEQRVKPEDKNPAHFPYEYEVGVDNMKCQNCAIRVENAFHERDGFLAKVHLKEKKADIYSKKPMSEEELRNIIQKSGYAVRSVTTVKGG